ALDSAEVQRVLLGHTDAVSALAFSGDGKLLASGSHDRTARIWDVAAGTARHVLKGHTGLVAGVAFKPDSSRLATAAHDQSVRVWSVADGVAEQRLDHAMAEIQDRRARVQDVVWSPDGRSIVSCSAGQVLWVWEPGGKLRH